MNKFSNVNLVKIKTSFHVKNELVKDFKSCLFKSHFLKVCGSHTYGLECALSCGSCNNGKPCNNINGTCHLGCNEGVKGNMCQKGDWIF